MLLGEVSLDTMEIALATVADATGIARVHVDGWKHTYRGIVPDDYLDGLSCGARERFWADAIASEAADTCAYVARGADGAIIGFASGGRARAGELGFAGELYAIYLDPAHARRGLGRRLVSAVASWLLQHDIGSMLVWVLEDNPARSFYEALGGRAIATQVQRIGGKELVEVAYGWDDIRGLVWQP
jgi:GNAT superfamily N-acetyltransferase